MQTYETFENHFRPKQSPDTSSEPYTPLRADIIPMIAPDPNIVPMTVPDPHVIPMTVKDYPFTVQDYPNTVRDYSNTNNNPSFPEKRAPERLRPRRVVPQYPEPVVDDLLRRRTDI